MTVNPAHPEEAVDGRSTLRRTGPIAPVSKKRARENRTRATTTHAAVTERSEGRCEARIIGVCTGRATDMHELLSRARGGDITDPAIILHICRACHDVITTHPAWAERVGFARPSSGPYKEPPWPPRPTVGPNG